MPQNFPQNLHASYLTHHTTAHVFGAATVQDCDTPDVDLLTAPVQRVSHDTHFNVPTQLLSQFNFHTQLHELVWLAHSAQRALEDLVFAQTLRDLSKKAQRDQDERKARLEELQEKLSSPTLRARTRTKLREALKDLRELPYEKGLQILVTYEGYTEHYAISVDELCDPTPLASRPKLSAIIIRRGKTSTTLHLDEEVRTVLEAMHITQEAPAFFSSLPQTYVALIGLARCHQRDHGLPCGVAYWAQYDPTKGAHKHPRLMAELLGYHKNNTNLYTRLSRAMLVLEHMTLSTYGPKGTTVHDVPLIEKYSGKKVSQGELPAEARAGKWVLVHLPEEIVAMNFGTFTQVPYSVLLNHKHDDVNTALTLLSQGAYQHARAEEKGLAISVKRLMYESGLMQKYRSNGSRGRQLVHRVMLSLKSYGLVQHVEDAATRLMLSWKAQTTHTVPSIPEALSKEDDEHLKEGRTLSTQPVSALRDLCVFLRQRIFDAAPQRAAAPPG